MAGYYINIKQEKRKTAGVKAPDDISAICNKAGLTEFTMPVLPMQKGKIYIKLWLLFVCTAYWYKLKRTVKKGDYVVFQHPMYGVRISEKMIPAIQKKGVRFVAVIHDLETLRKGIANLSEYNQSRSEIGDTILLKHFDKVICHNERMREYLLGNGFVDEQLVNLDIFDYLTNYLPINRQKGNNPSIAIAGNLFSGKCKYIYDIPDVNTNLELHLYGVNYDETKQKSGMIYHGAYAPDELPAQLTGDFGLVWDGDTTKTCGGNTGEYLRYNNPHKTSLYLVAGMPVVVWSKAAMADFVLRNKVGITVDSLTDLDNKIAEISTDEYVEMQLNAMKISEKLRQGSFFLQALDKCIKGFIA